MKDKKLKVGIIGCGNMGAAILSAIHRHYSVWVCDQDKTRTSMVRRRYNVPTVDLSFLMKNAKVVVLAVKPQNMEEVLKEIRPNIRPDHIIISIAAGITCAYIEKRLGAQVRVIRCMPNLPSQIGAGMTALCKGKYGKPNDLKIAIEVLGHIGETMSVEEKWMDAVTAVSGSGPAYVFLFLECWMKAAQKLGFTRQLSQKLVLATLKGSLLLYERSKEPAEVLRQRVTSKGGTTQAAIDVFVGKKFDMIFVEALSAACKRAKELTKKQDT